MSADQQSVEVYKKNARHIGHLRRIIKEKKYLGLFLGAGASKPLKFPAWFDLIHDIAKDHRVAGAKLMNRVSDTHTSATQMLFQHFRGRKLKGFRKNRIPTPQEELIIKAEWRKIIHEKLYARKPFRKGFVDRHPYLSALLSVIRESHIVINYNFDNLIEKGLLATRPANGNDRGFDSTWRACLQARPNIPLIYHPNGYLPDNLLEGPSEDLVFSEDAFADQLIDSMAGHYSSLLHHLSQTTCVFLGISLADPTLKHLLRQHARMHPGHLHYFIAYKGGNSGYNQQRCDAVREANFEVYNLITLFLDDAEIRSFFELLITSEENIVEVARAGDRPRKQVYYVTGVPGAGKSTVVSNFLSLETYDEWVDERPENLAKPWSKLTPSEVKAVDGWIADQFALRNYRLSLHPEGIHILDRCPLDPLSFTQPSKQKLKAKLILKKMTERSKNCISGRVILLTGNPANLSQRAKSRHKAGDEAYFRQMQDNLEHIYVGRGVFYISTDGMTVAQVTKRIAKHIHFEDYQEYNCDDKLRSTQP